MKVKYDTIVGVNSTQQHVEIKFRPAGSEASDLPETIHISPHADYLYLSFSWGGRDVQVVPNRVGANVAELRYEKRDRT